MRTNKIIPDRTISPISAIFKYSETKNTIIICVTIRLKKKWRSDCSYKLTFFGIYCFLGCVTT